MYNNKGKVAVSIMWIVIGIALVILSGMEIIDGTIFSGMGGALAAVGAIQLVRKFRYEKNDEYRNKVDIEMKDERNRLIRLTAWSYAGYLFVLIAAVVSVVCMVIGYTTYGQIMGFCVCGLICIYWISYMILQRKM